MGAIKRQNAKPPQIALDFFSKLFLKFLLSGLRYCFGFSIFSGYFLQKFLSILSHISKQNKTATISKWNHCRGN